MIFWANTVTAVDGTWAGTSQTTPTITGGSLFGGGLYGGGGGWLNSTQTSTSTTSTIYYQTIFSQTGSTMGLYNSPDWAGQWTAPPTWSGLARAAEEQRRQCRIDPQIERELNANYRNEVAAPAIIREREAAIRTAAGRARELLLSYLSDDQRRTFEEHGWFIVLGGRSGRRYRISGRSYAGNVALLRHDNDNVEASFCGHCDHSIPLCDQLLAQKVMLEVDEPAYIALANRRAA